MKSRFNTTLIFLCISLSGYAQAPSLEWDARLGGGSVDEPFAIHQTIDGGFVVGGRSDSPVGGDKTQGTQGGYDYWIVKTDEDGTREWDKRFGGGFDDELQALQQTSDGGFILAGWSYSGISGDKSQIKQGGSDYWLVKINSAGTQEWDADFGGYMYDDLSSAQQTSDGGYILGGTSDSPKGGDKSQPNWGATDYWIVKTDANGIKQWDKRFGGDKDDYLQSIEQTSDGGYILGGYSKSGISGDKTQPKWGNEFTYDYWIVKIDAEGKKMWDATFGGDNDDLLFSLEQTSDGGYILGGQSTSGISGDKTQTNQGAEDFWIVKTDENGMKQWDARFGGGGIDGWYQFAVQQTIDGGYILGGTSYSDASGDKSQSSWGYSDYWIVKTDDAGTKKWDLRFGGTDSEFMNCLEQAFDGGYILGGYTESPVSGDVTQSDRGSYDFWILKTTPEAVECLAPTGEFTSNIKSTSVKINWAAESNAQLYNVRYRETGTISWTKLSSQTNVKKLQGLSTNTQYDWSVKSVCDPTINFSSDWSATQNFTTKPMRLENENDEEISLEVFPNPLSSTATISFSLKEDSKVLIELFSEDGKKVITIIDDDFSDGDHQINFTSESLLAGIYFLQMKMSEDFITQKIIVE